MSSLQGIPLLSSPPPTVESSDACRKCNKEFNFLFVRSRKCNHCGFLYCHSCSDFQALMPRAGPESGYDPVQVCGYCIEMLNITAASENKLKDTSLTKLKLYADSYDININRAVEKGDIVEAIIRARLSTGCLPRSKEDHYRRHKVPNPYAGARPRSFFSRGGSSEVPPPTPPRPQAHSGSNHYRRGHGMHEPPNIPPRPSQPSHSQFQPNFRGGSGYPPHYEHHSSPYASYDSRGRPTSSSHASPPAHHPPPPPPQETRPPPPPRPETTSARRMPSRTQFNSTSQASPPRERTASTPSRPQTVPPPSTAPTPTLDQLLVMTRASISALSISVLKNILFINHVNATMILEKSELVSKVMTLVDDEKRERERQRMAEEMERLEEEERRIEREEAIRREQEERHRRDEERLRKERRERQRARVEDAEDDVDDAMDVVVEVSEDEESVHRNEPGEQSEPSTSAAPLHTSSTPQKPTTTGLDRGGLCVICQDEEANIAIVDCGHLAMCRACSELVMSSSKECPLCRTRIITEARLLRIFKS